MAVKAVIAAAIIPIPASAAGAAEPATVQASIKAATSAMIRPKARVAAKIPSNGC